MRRLVIMAALGCSLLLGACTSAGPSGSPPAGAGGVVPAPAPGGASTGAAAGAASAGAADVALRDDTRAICEQAARVGADAGRTFAADLRLLNDAGSAEDPAAAAKVREKASRDVQNYASALVDMAGLANDPALREALSRMAQQVSAAEGDVRTMDTDKLAGLAADLTAVCGPN